MPDQQTNQTVGDTDPSGLTRPGELHIDMGKTPKTDPQKITPSPTQDSDRIGLLGEAYKRGILPSDKKAAYEEALRRGLIPTDHGLSISGDTGGISRLDDIQKQFAEASRKFRGMDDDVDYNTGASWMAKVLVEGADNPKEAKLALEKVYGNGNAGQDTGGRWWVKHNGKKIEVFGGGQGLKTELIRSAATLQATSPETGGMIVGGAIGSLGGPLGSVAGAGIGGAAGKGLDDFRKWLIGTYAEKPKELGKHELESAIGGAAAEAGGQFVGKSASAIASWLRKNYFSVTPETQAIVRSFVDPSTGKFKATPPVVTYAPGAKALQYDQWLRNAVKGDPKEAQNVKFATQRLHDLLIQANVPDNDIADVFESIIDPTRAVSVAEEGRVVSQAVKAHVDNLEHEAATSLASAKSIADKLGDNLTQLSKSDVADDVHRKFARAVIRDRRIWGDAMSRAYDDIDAMVGDSKIIPTKSLKQTVKPIVDMLPKSDSPTIFHEIMGLPQNISIKEAQRLRMRLHESADAGNLTPGTVEHDYSEAAKSIDAVLDPDNEAVFLGKAPQAIRALRDADKAYAEGIQKYKDAKLNQMVRLFKTSHLLDADRFADVIFSGTSTFRINSAKQIVGPEVWQAVQAADTKNMLKEAMALSQEGPLVSRIDGAKILRIMEDRGPVMDAIYGKQISDSWREYAKQLAAIDGKISPQALQQGTDFSTVLQRSINAEKQLDDFVKNDVLKALRRGGPAEADKAIDVLTRPGQEIQLDHVIKFFGETSAPVNALRRAAIKRALSGAMTRTKTGTSTVISGESIDKFLSQYTKREQELLFPHGMAQDLRFVADQMKALFPGPHEAAAMGGALKAASIKGHVPPIPPTPKRLRATWEWVEIAFGGWLADNPTIIRAIADISRVPSGGRLMAQTAMRMLYRQWIMGGTQAITSTAEKPPKVSR